MSEPQVPAPPVTGVAEIDAALAEVDPQLPLAEQQQQLAAAVEVLQHALRNSA